MKVAIYTLTMNRLEYTKHCFKTLKEKSGFEYDHFIIDNGSKDGTREYITENFTNFVLNSENIGIGKACNQALDLIGDDYDLIIKLDNDCEVVSENIIGQIVECFEGIRKFQSRFILSPRVEQIVNQPTRGGYTTLAGRKVGLTAMVGGLFLVTQNLKFRYNEKNQRKGNDSQICDWFKKNGGEVGYIEGLKVNHYRGTNQQAIDYPEYFIKKHKEEKHEKVIKEEN